jgi:CheY-like chemotaxis protein
VFYEGELSETSEPSMVCDFLLIDDEEVTRYLLRQCLSPAVILEAASGPAGIEMAAKHKPQAILLDVRMEGMSGFEVLRELRNSPGTCEIPVVVMTSKPLSADELSLLNSYDAPVIPKEVLCRADAREQIRTTIRGRMGKLSIAKVRQ